jgi:thiol-disulfide isomerase/thioredoxin/YHS domain-containing protein
MLATRGLFFLAVLASAGIAGSAQPGVNWHNDLDSARKLAAQTNRLVLVHFWSKNCGSCVQMERVTFSQPEVGKSLEATFVPVKIDANQFPKIAQQYGINRVPTDLVLTPDGNVVNSSIGFYPPAQYVDRLNQIAAAARRGPGGSPPSGTPAGPGTAPDRALVAAGVQPPYGSAPLDPRSSGAAPAGRDAGPNRWSMPPDGEKPVAGAPPAVSTPGGYSVPPGAAPRDRNADLRGRPADESTASVGGRSIPPADRLAQWPSRSGVDTAASRRVDSPAAAGRNSGPDIEPPNRNAARPTESAPGKRFDPPLALDGFCPVTLVEQGRWNRGDQDYGVIHRGRTYLFTGRQEADRFFQNPDRYAPVLSGNDVVVFVDQGQTVPGRRAHGAVFNDRVYLFSSEASYEKFAQETDRYLGALSSPGKKLSRRSEEFRNPSPDKADARESSASRDARDSRNDRRFRDDRNAAADLDEHGTRDDRRMRDDRGMRDEGDPRDESTPSRSRRY